MLSLGSRGISLIGLLVGLAAGTVVLLFVAQLISSMGNGRKQFEFYRNAQSIKYEILGHLSQRTNCSASFGGVNPSTNSPIRNQLRVSGSPLFQTFASSGNAYADQTIRIVRYYFGTGAQSDFVIVDPVERKAMVSLFIEMQANNRQLAGVSTLVRSVKLSVDLNAANQIDSCVAAGNDEDSLWKLSGTSIFFRPAVGPARVGIGTNGPIAALDLYGFFKIDRFPASPTGGTLASATQILAPLFSAGTVSSANIRAQDFLYNSDLSLKENIVRITDWRKVLNLRGVQFFWRRDHARRNLGFLAQEIQEVYPELVFKRGDHLQVEYFQLIAPIIEATKDLTAQQLLLEDRIVKMGDSTRSQPER